MQIVKLTEQEPTTQKRHYVKVGDGETKHLIFLVEDFASYMSYFHEGKGISAAEAEEAGVQGSPKWGTQVMDATTGEILLFEFGKSVKEALCDIIREGELLTHIVKVKRNGLGLKTRYTVSTGKELSQADLARAAAVNVDLEELFKHK